MSDSDRRITAVTAFLREHTGVLPAIASQLEADTVFETAIRGESMAPSIPGHARVRVQTLPPESYRVGEVTLFLSDDGYMMHRIVYRPRTISDTSSIVTLGDNRLVPDPPVRADRFVGKVIAVAGNAGWQPPGPLIHRSVLHRISRSITTGALIMALCVSVPAARAVEKLLSAIEMKCRPIAGRLFRKWRTK